MGNPRFEKDDDIGAWRKPDENKVPCRDCVHRLADRPITDTFSIKGATLAECAQYFQKPYEVLWENESCPNYKKQS